MNQEMGMIGVLINKMNCRIYFLSLILAFGLILSSKEARADMYGFNNISGNNATDAAIGESQLFVEVTHYKGGENQVLFTFFNEGPFASSITDIYFDDGSLLGTATIDNSDPGVLFSQFATPHNLPAANNIDPPFVTSAGLSFDSDHPVQPNGVNPGESLGLLFNIQDSQTFADVINGLDNSSLRIGIHVQGFDCGGSESFVNNENPVPLPGAVLLGMLGLSIVGVKLRKLT